jgi:hypothetical protein
MKISKTDRGFDITEFTDRYGVNCSLQKTSLATEDTIWLGVSDVTPKIMATDAIKLGIDNKGEVNGWVEYDIPDEVLLSSRMHLTKEMVKNLLPYLEKFVETGELS